MNAKIVRRMGSTPEQRGSMTGQTCPDVLLMTTGDYLVIGKYAAGNTTWAEVEKELALHGAWVGDDETAVIVPAQCMKDAARDICEEKG